MCRNQYTSYAWLTPAQALSMFFKGELDLAPPQFIILNTMVKFFKYKDLLSFIQSFKSLEHNLLTSPNIVSLIPNNAPTKQRYPYAATLIGDAEFPYENCIKTQTEYLKEQLQHYKEKKEEFSKGKHRFLFQKPKQFFKDEYDFECGIESGILKQFTNWRELNEFLQKYDS